MNRFQIKLIKLIDYITIDINNFQKNLIAKLGNLNGKFVYEIQFNEELCKLTGRMYGTTIYIGKTTDLADRLYRHFKGLYESYALHPNMQKGRSIYDYVKSCNVKEEVLDNLGNYINVIVRDFTDSNIDINEAEAEFIKEYKLKYGDIPMFNDREEKTAFADQTKIRQFFDTSSLSNNGVQL
tara:strand:+ start:923 stop:1468 length:546 start_codon:yes stop_codon:yes gene_type:complete